MSSFYAGQSKNTFQLQETYNTAKITSTGTISFVSKCWDGRVSDEELTQQTGFLDKLEPTDEVMADQALKKYHFEEKN